MLQSNLIRTCFKKVLKLYEFFSSGQNLGFLGKERANLSQFAPFMLNIFSLSFFQLRLIFNFNGICLKNIQVTNTHIQLYLTRNVPYIL